MAISLKHIAKEADVSIMTASKILNLNESDRFRPETVKRVEAAALRLGYSPNRSAQVMRSQRSGIIGLVTVNYDDNAGQLENHPVQPFLTGLSHELGMNNQHVAMVNWTEFEPQSAGDLPLALRQRFFDGLVVHFGLSRQAHALLQEFDIPLLYWDSGINEPYNCLMRDEYRAASELIEHMYAYGYRNIAYYVGRLKQTVPDSPHTHFSAQSRINAYQDVVSRHGEEPIVLDGLDPTHLAHEIARSKADAMVISGTHSPAFYMAANQLALQGRPMPFACCDVEARSRFTQSIAGMSYDRFETGRIAARMLQSAIKSSQHKIPSQEIAAPFVWGSSLQSPLHEPGFTS